MRESSEQVAWFVLKELSQKAGVQWLGGRKSQTKESLPVHGPLLDQLETAKIPLSTSARKKLAPLKSLADLFDGFNLRSVREDSQRAIAAWLRHEYPLRLIHHIPTPFEMLDAQCAGFRYVTLLEDLADRQRSIGRHNGSLAFLLHDLEHADKFFGEPETFQGQVQFFNCLQNTLKHFKDMLIEEAFAKDFHYVISDMNSHPLHLFKYLKAVVLMYFLRKNQRLANESLSNTAQDELDFFWQTILQEWGMTEQQVASGIKINRPQLETADDINTVAIFFGARSRSLHVQ